jgi:NAD dependent epimerase/dehydratase family enzyme
MPWIHLADEIGLALLALEDARAHGPMNLAAPEPVRNRDLARALGRALSRPGFVPTPGVAVRAAVGEMADAVLASLRVVPRKALDLGYTFRFPALPAALADLVR